MKSLIAYITALILSLFTGKLVAGAISGILITPLVKPVENFVWIPRYFVPFVQGAAMGFVAVCTSQWVLMMFHMKLDWPMVALIAVGFAVIAYHLMKNEDERHFHLSAGGGELLGISLGGFFFILYIKHKKR